MSSPESQGVLHFQLPLLHLVDRSFRNRPFSEATKARERLYITAYFDPWFQHIQDMNNPLCFARLYDVYTYISQIASCKTSSHFLSVNIENSVSKHGFGVQDDIFDLKRSQVQLQGALFLSMLLQLHGEKTVGPFTSVVKASRAALPTSCETPFPGPQEERHRCTYKNRPPMTIRLAPPLQLWSSWP